MTPEQMQELQAIHQEVVAAKQRLAAAWSRATRMRVRDYEFQTPEGPVSLSGLFGDKSELVVVHNMGKRCVYCTMWADGLSGLAPHLSDRAALALSSPDEPSVQREFAASRGWPFRMVSTRGSTFAADMGFEQNGDPMPGYSAFHRDARGEIVRTGASMFGPGDDYCAIWPMMEQMERGVGGWEPRYAY